jgi:hypothetical protein
MPLASAGTNAHGRCWPPSSLERKIDPRATSSERGHRRAPSLTDDRIGRPEGGRLARAFFIAFACAAVLNGSYFWLRRVGGLDPERRRLYYTRFYHADAERYVASPEEIEALRRFTVALYRPDGWLVVCKGAKDVVLAIFLVGSAWISISAWRSGKIRPQLITAGPLVLLLGTFLASGLHVGWLMAISGLRSFAFLFVAALAWWAATVADLRFLARVLKALLVLQAVLVPVELWRGIHMFHAKFLGTPFGDRVVGTMLQPTTLGVFAVTAYVFHRTFAGGTQRNWVVACAAGWVVYLTASGTAILLMIAAIAWDLSGAEARRAGRPLLLASMLFLVVAAVGLPWMTGRPHILDSFWGRVDTVALRFSGAPAHVIIWGQGLGAATNTANLLFLDRTTLKAQGGPLFVADSTPTLLLAQTGVLGLVAIYGLIATAAYRDAQARPLYAVLVFASLALNLPEAFPMSVILGLLLARSLGPSVASGRGDLPVLGQALQG